MIIAVLLSQQACLDASIPYERAARATDSAVPEVDEPPELLPAPPVVDRLTSPATLLVNCPSAIPLDVDVVCEFEARWPDGEVRWAGQAALHQRGRSSTGFPKPQYRVTLLDAAGDEAPVDLFEMGSESDWVLNGMWIDRALLRNKLAWDLFRAMSTEPDWAPESVYVELTLDGAYQGVYLLNETVGRDNARLDFPADDGTGSRFIVSADEGGFSSRVQYAGWAIQYPPESQLTPESTSGITQKMRVFETAVLNGEPFVEADLDSFVRFVIIEELMKNNDGYFLSHRLWVGTDGLIRFVPWDLDLTLGQPNYNENSRTDTWIMYRPDLIARPAQTEAFRQRMVSIWTEARGGPLATEAVIERVNAMRAVLGPAIERNWTRWDITTVDFGGELYTVASADEEYARVEAWLRARLEWMDGAIADY